MSIFDSTKTSLVLIIRGKTKTGKTHFANQINGSDRSFFADTHGTNSTKNVLNKLENKHYKRVSDFTELNEYTKGVVKYAKDKEMITKMSGEWVASVPLSFVVDSASPLTKMAMLKYERDMGKKPGKPSAATAQNWHKVWKYIIDWLTFLNKHDFDIIFTSQMSPVYKNGNKTGKYTPQEWKSLKYHSTIEILLERGFPLKINGDKHRILKDNIFKKIEGTRFNFQSPRPYFTVETSRENLIKQAKEDFNGDLKDILQELAKYHKDRGGKRSETFLQKTKTLFEKENKKDVEIEYRW